MGMAAGRSRPMAASSSERGRRWPARLTVRSRVGDIKVAPAERCGRGSGDPGEPPRPCACPAWKGREREKGEEEEGRRHEGLPCGPACQWAHISLCE